MTEYKDIEMWSGPIKRAMLFANLNNPVSKDAVEYMKYIIISKIIKISKIGYKVALHRNKSGGKFPVHIDGDKNIPLTKNDIITAVSTPKENLEKFLNRTPKKSRTLGEILLEDGMAAFEFELRQRKRKESKNE